MSLFPGGTIVAETAYSSRAPTFTLDFSAVRLTRSSRVSGIDFASFYDLPSRFCKCSDSGIFGFPCYYELSKFKCPQYNNSMLAYSYQNMSTLYEGYYIIGRRNLTLRNYF